MKACKALTVPENPIVLSHDFVTRNERLGGSDAGRSFMREFGILGSTFCSGITSGKS